MSKHAVIIGIHGLDPKPPATVKRDWWARAICEGLARNCGWTVAHDQLPLDLCYWADWRGAPMAIEDDPQPYLRAPGEGRLVEYEQGMFDELAAAALDAGASVVDWFRRSVGFDPLTVAVVEAKYADLDVYYRDHSKRDELRDRLRQTVLSHRGQRLMLLAHSMGTIVAYDVLRLLGEEQPQCVIEHFVTIGSPLGLPFVRETIRREHGMPRTPSIVRRWTNLADRRDKVALDVFLADDYAPNGQGVHVVDDLVRNGYVAPDGEANPHKSYGYLRTPEVSRLIRDFL